MCTSGRVRKLPGVNRPESVERREWRGARRAQRCRRMLRICTTLPRMTALNDGSRCAQLPAFGPYQRP